jgi:HEAT repeat protein
MVEFSDTIQTLLDEATTSEQPRDAIHKLCTLKTEESQQALIHLLKSLTSTWWYCHVVQQLGLQEAVDPLPFYRVALEQPDSAGNFDVKRLVFVYLQGHREEATVTMLHETLPTITHPAHLIEMIHLLQNVGGDLACYMLIRLMVYHPDMVVQQEATKALVRLQNPQSFNALLSVMDDDTRTTDIRLAALQAIERLAYNPLSPEQETALIHVMRRWLYAHFDHNIMCSRALICLRNMDFPAAQTLLDEWQRYIDGDTPDGHISFFR